MQKEWKEWKRYTSMKSYLAWGQNVTACVSEESKWKEGINNDKMSDGAAQWWWCKSLRD